MTAEPRPLRSDAERNRRRVLDAAAAVFAEHGLDAGVDLVARAAGVGVGTIYRRFPTKEDLLEAVVADRLERFEARLAALDDDGDPWETFAAAAEALASSVAQDRGFYQVLQEARKLLPLTTDRARRCTIDAIAPILERAQRAGVVRADLVPVDVISLAKVGATLPAWRMEAEPELWRRYLAVVLDGMRPEAARPLPHPPPRLDPPQSGESTTSAA